MSRKLQQILIVAAILMTVALLMVFVGGLGVGEPEADSVDIYLNEIDTLVTEEPVGGDASSRLDKIAERAQRLEENRAETQAPITVPATPEPKPATKEPPAVESKPVVAESAKAKAKAKADALARAQAEAKKEIPQQVDEEPVAVIDDTKEAPKAKKEKKAGKPSKMKEMVKSYAKRMKPLLEARGMDLSDLEGKSPSDQIKAVGKKLIEAIRANGGSVFGA